MAGGVTAWQYGGSGAATSVILPPITRKDADLPE
jgi:hypothetical protein